MTRRLLPALLLAVSMWAQTPAPGPTTPTAAPPAAAPVPLTDVDMKSIDAPKPELRAKGYPDGALTGTVADVSVSDAKKGLTLADAVNQIGRSEERRVGKECRSRWS